MPSPFWILPLAGGFLFWGLLMIGDMFLPQSLDFYPIWSEQSVALLAQNPFAKDVPFLIPLGDYVWFAGFVAFVITLAAPVFRYRRSGVRVRQQLRWLMLLALLIMAGFIMGIVADLNAFALRARDEVDLERLIAAMLDVVQETVQPTQIYLWLQKNPPPKHHL